MAIELSPEMRAFLTLHLVPGLGSQRTQALIDELGTAQAVLLANKQALLAVPLIGPKLANLIAAAHRTIDVDAELQLIEKHRCSLIPLGDPNYPGSLAQIPSPPPILYLRGALQSEDQNAVAIVGSRQCTDYGRRMTRQIAGDLARNGYTIVSGLARGIDGEAHRGAIQAGGRTLAVLAGGLSKIYPPEHKGLSEEVEKVGALITEAVMKQPPTADSFPARNRIISGLSRAVVIVEAAEKSGALITAHHALDQGRSVLAVPGPVTSAASGGAHALIRNGAILCRSAADVMEELDGIAPLIESKEQIEAPVKPKSPPPDLDESQQAIWNLLAKGPRHLDEMVQESGISAAQLSGMLLMMEMKKAIRRLPGNRYEQT